ncbi:hypothetical protein Tco_0023837, partial [Tanacetum coccineum]
MSTLVFAYLVETDTKSKPFEDPIETETPESPHTVASPTSLPNSTPPTRYAEESKDSDTSGARSTPSDFTAPLLSDHPLTHTLPTLLAGVAAMSDSAFRKRFRSSYESLPSSSPPNLPLQKRSWGTSKLVEDDEEKDEEVEESSDSDSESEDAEDEGPTVEDEGPTAEDEGPAAGDEGLAVRDEGPGMRVESLGLGGDVAVPEGQQRAAAAMETAVGEPLGLGYVVLRRREIASREGQMPSVFEVGQGSGSVPESERPERVSALRQPPLTTWIDLEDGRAYINVPSYPPPTPHIQTPPSLEWSSGSLPVFPAPSIV